MTFVFALKRREKAILEVFKYRKFQILNELKHKLKGYTLNVNKLK